MFNFSCLTLVCLCSPLNLFGFNRFLNNYFPKPVPCLAKSSFCGFTCFHSTFSYSPGCLGCCFGNLSGRILGCFYCFSCCLNGFFYSTSCTHCHLAVSNFLGCIINFLRGIFCCYRSFLYCLC